VVASFLLRAINDPTTDVGGAVLTRLGWGAYPTVGAVIVARRPRNPVGWLCCAVGLLLGPAFFGQDYAWYALIHNPGSLPGGRWAGRPRPGPSCWGCGRRSRPSRWREPASSG